MRRVGWIVGLVVVPALAVANHLPGFDLDIDALGFAEIGESFSVEVSNLNAGETVYLMNADSLAPGPCPAQLGGQCMDIDGNAGIVGSAVADAAGVALLQWVVDPVTTPRVGAMQAVAVRGVGGVDSVKSEPIGVARVAPNGIARQSCGPDDSVTVALIIDVQGSAMACDDIYYGRLWIEIGTAVTDGDVFVLPDPYSYDAFGYYVSDPNNFDGIASGTVTLDRWTDPYGVLDYTMAGTDASPVFGWYDVTTLSGAHYEGPIYTEWCADQWICG